MSNRSPLREPIGRASVQQTGHQEVEVPDGAHIWVEAPPGLADL